MLPDAIDFLEDEDREGYVRILIAMAGADGTLVREETAAIEVNASDDLDFLDVPAFLRRQAD